MTWLTLFDFRRIGGGGGDWDRNLRVKDFEAQEMG